MSDNNNLDIICNDAVRELDKNFDALQYYDAYDIAIITINDEKVTFGNSRGTGNFDMSELVDGGECVGEAPFACSKHVVEQ